MRIQAIIIIDDKEINVLSFSFCFNQGVDTNGRPSQKPVFVGLKLIIETRKDLHLADWSFSPNETKQIELHMYPVIMGGKTRKLFFYDSHLVNWVNNFSSTGSNPMSETLEITAAGVEDSASEAVYSAYWRVTFRGNNVVATIVQPTEENELYDEQIKVTDNNGNPISDLFYCIEIENEIVDFGRTDANGFVKRTELKEDKEKYTYFWGDEAILKSEKL